MKERLLTNWTFSRVIYLAMGILIIVQAVMAGQFFGIFLGGYLSIMGLFAIGCASGNCFSGNCQVDPQTKGNNMVEDVEFEEIKSK